MYKKNGNNYFHNTPMVIFPCLFKLTIKKGMVFKVNQSTSVLNADPDFSFRISNQFETSHFPVYTHHNLQKNNPQAPNRGAMPNLPVFFPQNDLITALHL